MSSIPCLAQQRVLPHGRNIFCLLPRGVRRFERNGAVLLASLLLLPPCFCGLTGCHYRVYKASTLPPELAARPVIDVQRLDLSRMGGAVIQNEVIFPGDTLQIGIVTGGAEDHAEPWELRVDENGKVDVPLVGLVPIGGLNLLEAENMIGAAGMQRRVFRKPTVRVTVSQRRVNRVTVTGAVNKPDTYELPDASSHLAAALLAAGGLSEHADHMVEIHQPAAPGLGVLEPAKMKRPTVAQSAWLGGNAPASAKPNTVMVDLVDAVETARGAHYLHDGSIVTVRRRPDRIVHLIGLTGNRAINLPPNRNVRVLDALAQAGGPQYSYWIADNVKVIRAVPRGDETVSIKVSIRGAKRNGSENILLKSGDIVSVEENVITFTLGTLGQLIGIGTTAATGAATGLVP